MKGLIGHGSPKSQKKKNQGECDSSFLVSTCLGHGVLRHLVKHYYEGICESVSRLN